MATPAQKARLATLDASLHEHLKQWVKEHDISPNELVAVSVAAPVKAMLWAGKSEEEILQTLTMIVRATIVSEKDATEVVVNTRRPRLVAGGN